MTISVAEMRRRVSQITDVIRAAPEWSAGFINIVAPRRLAPEQVRSDIFTLVERVRNRDVATESDAATESNERAP